MPEAAFIPSISSGDVSNLTKITFFPSFLTFSTALSALKHISPTAAPGDAGNPFAIGLYFEISFGSIFLKRSYSNCFGSTLNIAYSFVIRPSLHRSIAIFNAALAERLPDLHYNIYNFPS